MAVGFRQDYNMSEKLPYKRVNISWSGQCNSIVPSKSIWNMAW